MPDVVDRGEEVLDVLRQGLLGSAHGHMVADPGAGREGV